MTEPDTCDCCEGVTPLTPAPIDNPPGQAALAYRVGTHARFKASMQAQIAPRAALSDLTTRDDDDASIALIDAWATTLDVLTFYQERIANEGYLRTATERLSILELARSIGYELRPGVAASTYLAFELETAPGSPEKVTLPIGTKAQTIPGQDERPQTFETVEAIEARPEWNKLKVKTTKPLLPVFGSRRVYLQGVTTQLKPGDGLLIVGREREEDPASERWDFRRVGKVTPDNVNNITLVEWEEGLGWSRGFGTILPAAQDVKVYAFRQKAALFGHNAPEWRTLPKDVRDQFRTLPTLPAAGTFSPDYVDWPDLFLAQIAGRYVTKALTGTGLLGEYFDQLGFTGYKFSRIDPTIDFNWFSGSPGELKTNTFSIRWTGQILAPANGTYTFKTRSDDGVRLWIDGQLLINKWFDRGSPATPDSAEIVLQAGERYDLRIEFYENTGAASVSLRWSGPGFTDQIVPTAQLFPPENDTIYLDTLYSSITPGSWLVLASPDYNELYEVMAVAEDARKNFNLAGKATRVTLKGENLMEKFNSAVRETVVYAASEALPLAEAPDTSAIAAGGNAITVQSKVTGLSKGHTLIIAGPEASSGAPIAEMVRLERLEADGTRLVFQRNLTHSYRREGTVVHANVAAATHGETKVEVPGSGDASQPFQKFVLKQSPLTYTATDQTPSGSISTLSVRVNDVLWQETPSLYGLGRRDRKYVTRIADDGKVTVMFGDGQAGARLPTGAENVQATYRVGTGLAGMVKANQISLLMTRPLGAKGVINPIAPEGAQDPETRDGARQNAPLTVLTLDRVVSLQDFEDFARAFSGIGKAQAVWLWDGERRIVHVTVAAADGGPVPSNSDLSKRLRNAITAAADPTQQFQIDSYTPLTFTAVARVKIDAAYLPDKVSAAITSAVQQAFAFEQRAFGQAVTASELIALMQRIEGVVFVDLDSLKCVERPAMKPPLVAEIAHRVDGDIEPAELLTLSKAANSLQLIVL